MESLQTTYQFYGLMEGAGHKEVTSDGVYQVAPMGRMILVKILKNAGNDKYKELKDALKSHYEGDKRVNDVFINNGGTVTIDCRD